MLGRLYPISETPCAHDASPGSRLAAKKPFCPVITREKQKTPGFTGGFRAVQMNLRGRYWDRTSDLFRVREARYRCANRPDPACTRYQYYSGWRWIRDSNPCIRLCRPLPRLSANPPCLKTVLVKPYLQNPVVHGFLPKGAGLSADSIRADDEIRTRDPHLGKVMRYHCATSATARIPACFEDSSR